MRLKTKFMNQVLAAVLTIAAAVAGHTSAWAQGISVTSSTSGTTTTFTITRSGSVLPAQTVNYRTVALSAFPGQNFNAVSGTLSFAANETSKTVTVTEKTPAASSKFGYSAGATSGYRNYRFEVLDLNGFLLAYRKRNWQVTGVITRAASGTWDLDDTRTGTFYSQSSGPIMITDDGYDSNPWDSFEPFDTQKYLSLPSTTFYEDGTRDYLYANGTQLRMTLELRAYEFDDGYLYLQVLTDNTSTCDNRSGCSNGDPGNISLSRYMAGFEMDKGDAYTTYKTYTFPVLSVGSGVGATDPWGYGTDFPLSMQKFKNGCRVRTVSLGTGVTLSGTETTYDVSGLTAIGTTALSYNGTIYSGEGQTLTLSHIGTAPTGYSFSGYSATAGTIDGSTFTMPACDVTITALFTENVMNLTDAADNTSVIAAAAGDGKQYRASFTRTFKAGQPSTFCLPFSFTPDEASQGKVYNFGGVDANWTVQMNRVKPEESETTTAFIPYAFIPAIPDGKQAGDDVAITFTGNATIGAADITAEGENPHTVEQGKCTFHGTYKRIDWQESYGRWYGFNAADGVFSHCIDGAYFPGLRCYLVYDPAKTSRGVEDAAPDDAPTVLKVIFNDGNRQTTAIGIIDSKTGEITLDKDCWYRMDGRKLQGKPAKKGLYINNGKKILVGDKR